MSKIIETVSNATTSPETIITFHQGLEEILHNLVTRLSDNATSMISLYLNPLGIFQGLPSQILEEVPIPCNKLQ